MKIKSSPSLLLLLPLSLLSFCGGNVEGAISLTSGIAYTQNFDVLASSGTSSTMPIDWVFTESGVNSDILYATGIGSSTTGDTYSFGGGSSSERALGGLQSGSLIPTFGASFTNNIGVGVIDLHISYTGEQWRLGTADANIDRLDFQYSTDAISLTSGTWVDFNSLDFSSPYNGVAGSLDGNAAGKKTSITAMIPNLNIANGATFWIRWNDFNVTSFDDGLAVDDFSVTAVPEPTAVLLGAIGLLGLLRRRR